MGIPGKRGESPFHVLPPGKTQAPSGSGRHPYLPQGPRHGPCLSLWGALSRPPSHAGPPGRFHNRGMFGATPTAPRGLTAPLALFGQGAPELAWSFRQLCLHPWTRSTPRLSRLAPTWPAQTSPSQAVGSDASPSHLHIFVWGPGSPRPSPPQGAWGLQHRAVHPAPSVHHPLTPPAYMPEATLSPETHPPPACSPVLLRASC